MTSEAERHAARRRVRKWARRASRAIEPEGALRGASPEEIAAVAEQYGVSELPAAIEEFLVVAGGDGSKANWIFNPEVLGVRAMLGLPSGAHKTAVSVGFDEAAWHNAIFVAGSSNDTVMWVYPDSPDPAVHALDAGGVSGSEFARFTDYLDWALRSYLGEIDAIVQRQS